MPEARRRFEAALAAAQAFAPAHQGLGGIALSEGRIGEAIQHLQAALRIEPANANASAMLAGNTPGNRIRLRPSLRAATNSAAITSSAAGVLISTSPVCTHLGEARTKR